MKYQGFRTLVHIAGLYIGFTACAIAQTFSVQDAGDFGNSHPSYPASKAVDGNIAFSSRWAATFNGGSADLYVDLGEAKTVDDIGVAWGRGNGRSYDFEVRARASTNGQWTRIYRGTSSGNTSAIERYNVDDFNARQVRLKVFSNSAGSDWADVVEFQVYGTSGPGNSSPQPQGNSTPRPQENPTPPPQSIPTRFEVPGLIQAEDFSNFRDQDNNNRGGAYRNTAVDIQPCSDSGCGFNIGWMAPGEWLEYNIDVSTRGAYEASLRVASQVTNGQVSLAIDGNRVGNNQRVNSTRGWQSWQTQRFSLGDISAGRHTLRVTVEAGTFNLNWINIQRSGSTEETPVQRPTRTSNSGNFGLDPNAAPWDNFDLSGWSLDTPAPRDNDACKAERTWDYSWRERNPLDRSSQPFFFTHTDGGMRFVSRIDGQTTSDSCNSGFVRSELREMLRDGDRNVDDTGVSKNNWKLGYQPGNNNNWGGVNGALNTTLRVNQVTTTGSASQVGRVIIGQIHAGNDEPLRLYYRKRVGQSKGCIYFAHEIRNGDDINFPMIGDLSCTSAPSDGIALDELFSYSIVNRNEDITVTIRRGDNNGPVISRRTIDMDDLNSGYDRSDEWMYFKAGAYTQNSTGNGRDGDIVTIYRLSTSHD